MNISDNFATVNTIYETGLLNEWLSAPISKLGPRDKILAAELHEQATQFLALLMAALKKREVTHLASPAWDAARYALSEISQSRALQNLSPIEAANFVFSLQAPLVKFLRLLFIGNTRQLTENIAATQALFDSLGLYPIEVYRKQRAREQISQCLQSDSPDLSKPVVQLWRNILASYYPTTKS